MAAACGNHVAAPCTKPMNGLQLSSVNNERVLKRPMRYPNRVRHRIASRRVAAQSVGELKDANNAPLPHWRSLIKDNCIAPNCESGHSIVIEVDQRQIISSSSVRPAHLTRALMQERLRVR